MKKFTKLIGIIAFMAVIGFSMTACEKKAAEGEAVDWESINTDRIIEGKGIFVTTGATLGVTAEGWENRIVRIAYSRDGKTWKAANTPFPAHALGTDNDYHISAIAYGNNRFVASGWQSTGAAYRAKDFIIAYSHDGINWTAAGTPPLPDDNFFPGSMAFGSGRFLMLGSSYEGGGEDGPESVGRILVSPNGEKWTETDKPFDNLNYITFEGGRFLVVDMRGGRTSVSPNGEKWSAVNNAMPDGFQIDGIAKGHGRFVMIGRKEGFNNEGNFEHTGCIAVSTDGEKWTQAVQPLPWPSISFDEGKFRVVDELYGEGEVRREVSTDGVNWTNERTTPSVLGRTGPGGGIIFYDKGIVSDGWQYLELAPVGTEFKSVEWGPLDKELGGTRTEIGSGKRNTQIIVEQLRQLGESGKAAQLCANLNRNGLTDWFLPSISELELMYKYAKRKGWGGFSDVRYWSSTESGNEGCAWFQDFSDSGYGNYYKNNRYNVRAIRAFSVDSVNWAEEAAPPAAPADWVPSGTAGIAGEGIFVTADNEGRMAYSRDGKTWSAATNTPFPARQNYRINHIAYGYGNDSYVAAGYQFTGMDSPAGGFMMAYSPDGINWTKANCPLPDDTVPLGIACGNGRFVMISSDHIAVSTDGANWTEAVTPFDNTSNTRNTFRRITFEQVSTEILFRAVVQRWETAEWGGWISKESDISTMISSDGLDWVLE